MTNEVVTLKWMKSVIRKFQKTLNAKLMNCFFDIKSLGYLSWRKVYKLLKLSFENENKSYDKRQLKLVAKFLEFYNDDLSNKKNVKFLYKLISLNNVFNLILSIPVEVFEYIFNNLLNSINFDFRLNKPKVEKKYIEFCSFLI